MVVSSAGSIGARGLREPEDEGNVILLKVGNFCPSTRHSVPKDFNFQQYRYENFKYLNTSKVSVVTRKRLEVLNLEKGAKTVKIILQKKIFQSG